MTISTFEEAKSWFKRKAFTCAGFFHQGGGALVTALAEYGSRGKNPEDLVRQVDDVLYSLYSSRGREFVARYAFPLIHEASQHAGHPPLAASFLLTELQHLQQQPVSARFERIAEMADGSLPRVAARFGDMVNRQQFYDPKTNGGDYHKDTVLNCRKEAVVGRAGAELHGNVMYSPRGAFALIGYPRVGKGRISFLLAHLFNVSLVSEDRVHMLFSKGGVHVVGPNREHGFRTAMHYYKQGRRFYEGVFGGEDSPHLPAALRKLFWHPGVNTRRFFRGKPVCNTMPAPLHGKQDPLPLHAVFLVEAHSSGTTRVEEVTHSYVANYLSRREDAGVPTIFGCPQTYVLQSPPPLSERRVLSDALVEMLKRKGVKFFRVLVPRDPAEIPVHPPTRSIEAGTPFDNRMRAAEEIARRVA